MITFFDLIMGIIISWIASVLAFPTLPFQHWLNSRLRSLSPFPFRKVGLNGTWIATFTLVSNGHKEKREEIIKVNHLYGGELRGKIRDRHSETSYKFQGKLVFNDIVGHYWPTEESEDIGSFKLKKRQDGKVLEAPFLTTFISHTGTTKGNLEYTWYYLPPRIVRFFFPIRKGPSQIDRTGLFANEEFKDGSRIGRLGLGKEKTQGEYTIKVNDKHRLVKSPWCYLNHSCEPNAKLDWKSDCIYLTAIKHIFPQMELTIDYRSLPEKIGTPFSCHCIVCQAMPTKPVIS